MNNCLLRNISLFITIRVFQCRLKIFDNIENFKYNKNKKEIKTWNILANGMEKELLK